MPRVFRLLAFLFLVTLGLPAVQPAVARASAVSALAAVEHASQATTPDLAQQGGAQPGPIVRQAYDLLLDRFVIPTKPGDILNGALNGAHFYLESKQVADPLAERPAFTGNRSEDWRLFLPAYAKMKAALGDKGPVEILDRAMVDGMARSFDEPHTYYLPPEIYRQQMAELQNRNRYSGVGIQMTQDLVITDVFEGSPAEAAGLMPGDQLVAVNGESIEGLTSADTSTRVRGENGTQVTLTVRRGSVAEPITKTMTRATISYDWIRAKILDGNIGYLQIRTFAVQDALPLFNQAMEKFAAADVRALIIDVRGNTGGVVATGEEILSRIMPQSKPIYRQVDRRGERTVSTWGDYWNRDIPIAVLTNGNSGSMSEIMAAALQENGFARIIGTKTAGAVAAAVPVEMVDGSGLFVTVQIINTPNGRVINKVGLEPDDVVELDPAQFRAGKDTQLEAGLAYVRSKLGG
ncbi:MAG: PDZ domain-containing protein [Chloroflexi bacterium]|nr:PDZ domain-containing protein [Chloroflexota bacterium]